MERSSSLFFFFSRFYYEKSQAKVFFFQVISTREPLTVCLPRNRNYSVRRCYAGRGGRGEKRRFDPTSVRACLSVRPTWDEKSYVPYWPNYFPK
jgi:hypothetical protein